MKIFNDNWFSTFMQLVSAATIVFLVVVAILIFHQPKEKVTTIPADTTDYVIFNEGVDISDRIISFNFDPPTNIVIEGTPRMVTPQAIIDFSGDKVTYSGDLPVDEAAKVFFDALMGYVKEAKECKDESK